MRVNQSFFAGDGVTEGVSVGSEHCFDGDLIHPEEQVLNGRCVFHNGQLALNEWQVFFDKHSKFPPTASCIVIPRPNVLIEHPAVSFGLRVSVDLTLVLMAEHHSTASGGYEVVTKCRATLHGVDHQISVSKTFLPTPHRLPPTTIP